MLTRRKPQRLNPSAALSTDQGVLVPILEEIPGWNRPRIRSFFEEQGLLIQGWDKVQADWLIFRSSSSHSNGRARAGH